MPVLAADWDKSISRGSRGTAAPLSVKDVSLMLVHRPYTSSSLGGPATAGSRGSARLFMAMTCWSPWAASSSVGGAAPLVRLKLFQGALFSCWRLTLSRLLDFLVPDVSTVWVTAWPGGLVLEVVLELSGSPESKLRLLRAS